MSELAQQCIQLFAPSITFLAMMGGMTFCVGLGVGMLAMKRRYERRMRDE